MKTDFEKVASVCAWEVMRFSEGDIKLARKEQFSYVWADGRRIYATNGALCVSVLDNRQKGFYYPNGKRAELNKTPLDFERVFNGRNGRMVIEKAFRPVLDGRAFKILGQEEGKAFNKEFYKFCKEFVGGDLWLVFDDDEGKLLLNGSKGIAALRCCRYGDQKEKNVMFAKIERKEK